MSVATREMIRHWLNMGKNQGSTHVIIVCDTWDYEDFPVFVSKGENIQERVSNYRPENMEKVMEVYNLSMDLEKQLNSNKKAYNL